MHEGAARMSGIVESNVVDLHVLEQVPPPVGQYAGVVGHPGGITGNGRVRLDAFEFGAPVVRLTLHQRSPVSSPRRNPYLPVAITPRSMTLNSNCHHR